MSRAKVFGIAGWHNSGKTAFLESLVDVLCQRGLRVGVIKHTRCELDMDTAGTDTYRMAQVGAKRVALVGPSGAALYDYGAEPSFDEMVTRMSDGVDVILVEGYKRVPMARVEVRASAVSEPLPIPGERLAIVCGEPLQADIPVIAPDDMDTMLHLLEQRGLV